MILTLLILIVAIAMVASSGEKSSMRKHYGTTNALEENYLSYTKFLEYVKDPVNHPEPDLDAAEDAAREIYEKGFRPINLESRDLMDRRADTAKRQIRYNFDTLEKLERESISQVEIPSGGFWEHKDPAQLRVKYKSEYDIIECISEYFFSYHYDCHKGIKHLDGVFGACRRGGESEWNGFAYKEGYIQRCFGQVVDDSKWVTYCNEMEEKYQKLTDDLCIFALSKIREYRSKVGFDPNKLEDAFSLSSIERLNGKQLTRLEDKCQSQRQEEIDSILSRPDLIDAEKQKLIERETVFYDNRLLFIERLKRLKLDLCVFSFSGYPYLYDADPEYRAKVDKEVAERGDGILHYGTPDDPEVIWRS